MKPLSHLARGAITCVYVPALLIRLGPTERNAMKQTEQQQQQVDAL